MQARNLHLEQLQRDAAKAGAWQAKLALGRYLLKEAESLRPNVDAASEKSDSEKRATLVKRAELAATEKKEEAREKESAAEKAIAIAQKAKTLAENAETKAQRTNSNYQTICVEQLAAMDTLRVESAALAALKACDHHSSLEDISQFAQNSIGQIRKEKKKEAYQKVESAENTLNKMNARLEKSKKKLTDARDNQRETMFAKNGANEASKKATQAANEAKQIANAATQAVEDAKSETDKKIESAKKYFTEVSNSNASYAEIAKLELGMLTTKESASNKKQVDKNFLAVPHQYRDSTTESPETQYKTLRLNMQEKIDNGSLSVNLIDEAISKFKHLLQSLELTDTLKAKLYFQLIHLHLQKAHQTGRLHDLNHALAYCDLLCADQHLKDMNKTKMANKISVKIRKKIVDGALRKGLGQKISNTGFLNWIIFSAKSVFTASRSFFKYLGLLIGNVMDFSFFLIPKYFKKDEFSPKIKLHPNPATKEWKENWIRVGLKHRGLARTGRWIGKHVLGNLLAPISIASGIIAGIILYPFIKLTELFSEQDIVKDSAKKLLDLTKAEPETQKSSIQNSSIKAKKIFGLNADKIEIKKSIAASTTNKQEIELSRYALGKGRTGCSYAYGRVFAAAPPKRNSITQPLQPVYISNEQLHSTM